MGRETVSRGELCSAESLAKHYVEKTRTHARFASQAAWYRMENGPKAENGKKLAEVEKVNGPWPEMGRTWPKNGEN